MGLSTEQIKALHRKIGYNPDEWNPEDPNEVAKLATAAGNALLNLSLLENPLSWDEIDYLNWLLGRG